MQKLEYRESVVLENKGQKIFGIMHRPISSSTSQTFPAILICHGLAGHKTGKFRMYVTLAEKLAQQGIVCLRIDFRGSGDSEGDFIHVTIEEEISDALVGLEFLKHSSFVDSNRIGLFGRSVGGTVALMTASRIGYIKTLATWAPLFDGHQWIEKWKYLHSSQVSEDHRLAMMRVNGQLPGVNFFNELFNINMSQELKPLQKTPFLLIHGERDGIVSIEHARKFATCRLNAQAENKFINLPESDHDFSHFKEQQLAINETSKWLIKTL